VLGHLRQQEAVYFRGCWLIDLLEIEKSCVPLSWPHVMRAAGVTPPPPTVRPDTGPAGYDDAKPGK
jgi:hypothetical protein